MSQRQGAGELSGTASSASPEATGGAGTVMEHRYGATLLAALVLHEPVPGLGGVLVPVKVAFQKADLAFEAGTALLGLAVKGPHGPADELDVLSRVAAAHGESVVTGRGRRARGGLASCEVANRVTP